MNLVHQGPPAVEAKEEEMDCQVFIKTYSTDQNIQKQMFMIFITIKLRYFSTHAGQDGTRGDDGETGLPGVAGSPGPRGLPGKFRIIQ